MHTCIVRAAIQSITHNAYMRAAMLCMFHEQCCCALCAEHCYRKSRDQINRKRGGNVPHIPKNTKIVNDMYALVFRDKRKKINSSCLFVWSRIFCLYSTFYFSLSHKIYAVVRVQVRSLNAIMYLIPCDINLKCVSILFSHRPQ